MDMLSRRCSKRQHKQASIGAQQSSQGEVAVVTQSSSSQGSGNAQPGTKKKKSRQQKVKKKSSTKKPSTKKPSTKTAKIMKEKQQEPQQQTQESSQASIGAEESSQAEVVMVTQNDSSEGSGEAHVSPKGRKVAAKAIPMDTSTGGDDDTKDTRRKRFSRSEGMKSPTDQPVKKQQSCLKS